jgi:hypothetical protein
LSASSLLISVKYGSVGLAIPPVAPEPVGVDGEPRGVEHVAEVAWELVGVGRVAQRRVDDEPVALGRELLHLGADRLAGEAPPAVAADHPRRAEVSRGAAVERADAHGDAGAVVLERDGLDAGDEARVGRGAEPRAEHPFEGRLVEEAGAEVAVRRRGVAGLLGEQHGAVVVDHLEAAEGGGVDLELGHRAGGLEVPQRLLVDVGGAGGGVHLRVALEHGHPDAEVGEEVREHQARRAAADHQHVAIEFHARLRRGRQRPHGVQRGGRGRPLTRPLGGATHGPEAATAQGERARALRCYGRAQRRRQRWTWKNCGPSSR